MKKLWLTGIIPVVLVAAVGLAGCGTAPTSTTSTAANNSTPAVTTIVNTVNPSNPGNVSSPGAYSSIGTSSAIFTSSQGVGIWVNGTGDVTVTPDIANLNLGVSDQETTVAAAQANAAAAMTKIMAVLKANNVADKDIQTTQFNINPAYNYNNVTGQSNIIGYNVMNIVNVKIRDLNNVGKIIDAVATAGGDLTVINSISFAVDNPSQYYTQARQLAMTDAKAKATQLATLAGVTLGAPIYITDTSSNQVTQIYAPKAIASGPAQTSISAGETDIVISVQVTYSIQ